MTSRTDSPDGGIDVSVEYAFRVTGRLTPDLLGVLDPLEADSEKIETVLVGPVADRAALQGLIARIEALGLELVELRKLPRRTAEVDADACCPGCGRDGRDSRARHVEGRHLIGDADLASSG